MKEKVLKYIYEHKMIEKGDTIIVGVSGGPDSMCLLDILLELKNILGIEIVVVHIHHGIREQSAQEDLEFVEKYCKNNRFGVKIPFKSYRFDCKKEAYERKMSVEDVGRSLRYGAFKEVADCYKNAKIAVAHNLDDTAETILFNLFRGSGIKGLSGIRPVRDEIVRPLLCLTKDEILEYLDRRNIDYCIDETNLQDDYTRNRIRLRVLPFVKEHINEKASEHIVSASEDINEAYEIIDQLAESAYKKYILYDDKTKSIFIQQEISCEKNIVLSHTIRKVVNKITGSLKDVTNTHIKSVVNLLQKEVSSMVNLPYKLVAIREYNGIRIETERERITGIDSSFDDIYITIDHFGSYEISQLDKVFNVEKDRFNEDIFKQNKYTKWFDYDILNSKLVLRTRQTGDYIIVDKAGSKKKLKDYYIDMKIPKEQRDAILVLANGHEILWVVGYRIGENYKVSEDTTNIVKIDCIDKKQEVYL